MAGFGSNFVPTFSLWSSDGLTLIYTFPAVEFTNAPQQFPDEVEITNLRSSSAITIDGGQDKPWDLQLNFTLYAQGYTLLTDEIEALESAIQVKTNYLLRFQKSDTLGDFFEIKVRRKSFTYSDSLRRNIQKVVGLFRANSW